MSEPPAPAYERYDLTASRPDAPPRSALLRRPGWRLVRVNLAPTEQIPEHRHPGCDVVIQGVTGTLTAHLASEVVNLSPGHLLVTSGEAPIALRNHGDTEVVALVVLIARSSEEEG